MDRDEAQTNEHPREQIPLLAMLSLTAAMMASADWLSRGTTLFDSRLEWIWLPGATALCLLLVQPKSRWWPIVIIAWLTSAAISMVTAPQWNSSVIAAGGKYLLVILAAHWLVGRRTHVPYLQDIQWILLFVGVAFLLSAACTAWERWIASMASAAEPGPSAFNQWIAQCSAYLIVVPAWLGALTHVSTARSFHAPMRVVSHLIAAVPVVVACVISLIWPQALVYAAMLTIVSLFTTLLWLGTGSAFTMALILAIAYGPVIEWIGVRANEAVMGQFAMLMAALALIFMAVAVEQRAAQRHAFSRMSSRLGELTSRMLFVQEEERARIARDLHDDINQSIASISIQISALKKELDHGARDHLDEIQNDLLGVSADIRRLSHDLHPSILRYTSLADSLLALCQSSSTGNTLHVECHLHEDMALSNEQKLNLFRIAQEAIHNVETHAHASCASVSLFRQQNEAVLRVDDNGIGMPRELSLRMGCGLGMISMEERARSIGGIFEAARLEQGGSRLEVRIPLGTSGMDREAAARTEIILSPDR